MPKQPLPKIMKTEVDEFVKLDRLSKDASNAANRQKTKLRNAIKNHWTVNQLPIGSFIRAGGIEFRYEATESSIIDPEEVLSLFEKKEITREQFLSMMKVSATDAKKVLGGDQVADFTTTVIGDTVDIRTQSLPVENEDDEYIMEAHKVRKKVKRRVFGGKAKPTERTPSKTRPRKRAIKTRTSK